MKKKKRISRKEYLKNNEKLLSKLEKNRESINEVKKKQKEFLGKLDEIIKKALETPNERYLGHDVGKRESFEEKIRRLKQL